MGNFRLQVEASGAEWFAETNRHRRWTLGSLGVLVLVHGLMVLLWGLRTRDADGQTRWSMWIGPAGILATTLAIIPLLVRVHSFRVQCSRFTEVLAFARPVAVAAQETFRYLTTMGETISYFFEGSEAVSEEEFRTFCTPLLERMPAEAIAWAPVVGAVPGNESESTEDLRFTFAFLLTGTVPPGHREVLESVEARRATAGDSWRDGRVRISTPFTLPRGDPAPKIAMAIPVRPSVKGGTGVQRGVVVIFVPVHQLLSRAAGPASLTRLTNELEDLSLSEAPRTLAIHPIGSMPRPACGSPLRRGISYPLFACGRSWRLGLYPDDQKDAWLARFVTWPMWLLGGALGCALALLVAVIEREQQTLERNLRQTRTTLESRDFEYRRLIEEIIDGFALHVMIFDGDGRPVDYRFLQVNPAFERLTGLPAERILGRRAREVLPHLEEAWIEQYGRVTRTGQPEVFEHYSADLKRHYEVHAYRPAPALFATIFREVTARREFEGERLRLERRLLHTQRLESLGVLAGGIAHDFNNILMTILGNVELARMGLRCGTPAEPHLQEIETAAHHAADLCRQMLNYAGKGRTEIKLVDLNALIEEMLHLLKTSISRRAILNLHLEKGIPPIRADVAQIRQIVMNLVLNASEVLEDRSGTISITTGVLHCDRRYLESTLPGTDLPEGLYVVLEVAVTGCGMDPATLQRIFDPFFSTKFTGRGLGLSAVLGIVRAHRGAIKVYSELGKGSIFKILLPAADGIAIVAATKKDPNADSWRGEGTVLLVDDEDSVRTIAAELLRHLGFRVVEACNGAQTLAQFSAQPAVFRVVMVDLTMPDMSGLDVLRRLREIRPDIKAILVSGYSAEELAARYGPRHIDGFLQKPYSAVRAARGPAEPPGRLTERRRRGWGGAAAAARRAEGRPATFARGWGLVF